MAKDRGRYGSVYSVMQESPEWQRLSLDAAAVWYALKLGRDNNTAGVFPFYREALAERSRVPLERVQDALRELEREDWIRLEGSWVWLRNSLLYDPHYNAENANQLKGLLAVVGGLPHIQLVRDFVSYYRDLGYLPPDFEHVEKAVRMGRVDPPKGIRRVLPDPESARDEPSNPKAVAVAVTEANTETEASKLARAREPDDSGPRTPATPAEARDLALSVLGAPSPPDPATWVHGGVAYRAGDTLPDGRRVESVEGGVPVLTRPPKAGAPGELEVAQRELMAELPKAAEATRMPADLLLAKHSRTPTGRVIVSPWNCTSLAWLRATTQSLVGARLSAQADAYAATPPPERDSGADYQRVRALADEYGAWCVERQRPAGHIASRDAWLAESGREIGGEEARMVFAGEMRRLADEQRERAAS